MKLPAIVSSSIALILSATLWWQGTDGFSAFTSETARRSQALKRSVSPPDVHFKNQNNQEARFSDYLGKVVLADFIYTGCPDVCHNLGYALRDLQKKLEAKGLLNNVKIISISFDREHDRPRQLQAYLQRYTQDASSWNALRVDDAIMLDNLLDSFGVVVLKNEAGGYEHNAAVYVIDKNGKLSGIYDYQSTNEILAAVQESGGA